MQKPNITYFGYPGIKEAYKFDVTTLFRIEQLKCYQELRDVVCEFYTIEIEKFHSKDRTTPLPEARQLFCYVAKLEMFKDATLKGIGRFIYYNPAIGKQYDHTTVMHGIQEVTNRLDPKIQRLSSRDIDKIVFITNTRLTEVWMTMVSNRKKIEGARELLQSKTTGGYKWQ